MKFEELGIGKGILEVLKKMHLTEPTPIQEKSMPLVYEGRDVIGNASTGSGKTLAFGAAILEKVKRDHGTQALIMAPTRELAEQVAKALRKFGQEYDLNIEEVYGGVSINPQISRLKHAEIVVGTPGRILDHLERRTLNLSKLSFLVLDEADRMVDMGFIPDVEKIIKSCPRERQTLLFSATTSPDVAYIEKNYMNKPITVTVESYVDPSKLTQTFYDVQIHEKFSLLVHLLKHEKSTLTMVFCNTRANADMLVRNLERYKLDAIAIHGGLNQAKRSNVMSSFHGGSAKILICTDIAARGLHINNVSHIYNYDIPPKSTDYIHRIGRTARAGKEGEAISLVSNRDYQNFRRVLDDPALNIQHKDLPEFEKLKPLFSTRGRTDNNFSRRSYGRDHGSRREGGSYRRENSGNRSFGRDRGDRRDGNRRSDNARRHYKANKPRY